ncbi:TRAP-type C4-dicarboxylate transport system, small permease component [Olavius algarvensis Delta 1 endosymbiont]|nr:TRAP-type C4-dicarboxylate transport system, small permease component [Olavius algarvensis Delta 1 endosymbiont]
MYTRFRKWFERLLEAIVIILMSTLTIIVLVAVAYRKGGASLSWYDEIASVLLAWLTYYGAALAALHRGHIGFGGLIKAMQPGLRIPFIIFSEFCVLGFFALLAWVGVDVLIILEGDSLVSLPQVPTRLTQSVIPIGAVLFIIAEALGIPDVLREARKPDGFTNDDVPDEADDPMEVPQQ